MSFAAHADAWLAEVMGRPVFRVDGSGDTAALAPVLGQPRAFAFAKIPTDRVADVSSLGALGFAVVDTSVTFELAQEIATPPRFDVGKLLEGEADAVLDIAGSAFRYSRFHLDPKIDDAVAHTIKREWIRNYVLGKRGDALFVARDGGRPVGFLAALVANGTAVIDLVAVANDAHGKGVGTALTAGFVRHYAGMPRKVGTQVANVPSIRLYTKLGFVLSSSSYVLHLHV